jgi:GAF domain-containing protein
MITAQQAEAILQEADALLQGDAPIESRLQALMQRLHDRLPHYHWVGIYWLEGDTLVLGPYVGPPTEHVRIPVGRGVCGTAVAENTNQIVRDVRERENYLACNLETRSEIVVLLRHPETGAIIGQIDVDGTEVGAFDESDEAFLDALGRRIARAIYLPSAAR